MKYSHYIRFSSQRYLAEMRENFVNMWRLETIQGQRAVHNLLHCERKNWHSMVPSGNRETTKSDGGGGGGQMPPVRSGG